MTRPAKGRLLVAAMAIVTAWSAWTFAQPQPHGAAPSHRPAPPPAAEAAGEGHGEAAGHEEGEHGPAAINWSEFGTATPPFVAVLINFVILIGGYYALGKKPVAEGLVARRDAIAKQIEEAANMRREAEERAKTYQARLDALDVEMKTAREALVRAGEAERERVIKEAEAKAERMQRDAEFMVQQEIKQLRLDLQRETVEAAMSAAEELLRRRITPADQERLAEDYLADLGSKTRAATAATTPRESAS